MKKFFSYLFLITIFLSFSYGLAFSVERDLKFLKELSNEELSPIVAVIKNEKDNKLSEKEKNNPQKYLDRVIENLEKVAINELNIKDSKSVSYKQILETVCKKQNIPFDNNISTQELGTVFVKHAFVDIVNKMSKKQREGLVSSLREVMNEEEFEVFLEDVGGTNGLLVSSGETISNLLFSGYLGSFMTATCLVSDIANVVDLKQLIETDEQQISYKGIVPALTYIESLRITKEQMPETENDSDILNMLIVVSIPVICVLLLFICLDPKKRAIFFKFVKFLFICLFVAIVLLFVMLVVETAENYIVVALIACILLVSLLLSWMFSIQRRMITKKLNKSILKNANNVENYKVSKKQNSKEKIISKTICPKCNTQNSKTNYSCTNCHYVFTDENQEVKANEEKKESENKIKTNSKIKEKIEKPNNKDTQQINKSNKEATETSKDENVRQKDKTENETKEKSETSDTKEVKEANKTKEEVEKISKNENKKRKKKKKKKR